MTETTPDSTRHDPDERGGVGQFDWLELATTIVLSLAAVLIAWATYQGSLWGGVQDTNNTASVLSIVDASDEFGRADAVRSLDQLLFVDFIAEAERDPNSAVADLLLEQMSPAGVEATAAWFDNDQARPFDDPVYIDITYETGREFYEAAFAQFDAASDANSNGDSYSLWATVLAVVLFLAGISLVLESNKVRIGLVAAAGVVLIVAVIAMLGLPLAP